MRLAVTSKLSSDMPCTCMSWDTQVLANLGVKLNAHAALRPLILWIFGHRLASRPRHLTSKLRKLPTELALKREGMARLLDFSIASQHCST